MLPNNLANVSQFLKNNENGIIVVYGPTGSGKTSFSLEIAKIAQDLNFFPVIISADSRQIYQEMNIGTGKILPHEMENIIHLGLDIISPTEKFSVVEFKKNIENSDIWKIFIRKWTIIDWNLRKKIVPIICWGTGLYIDSLIFERNYLWEAPNKAQREELENFRIKNGNDALWKKLYDLDPDYARDLHPNNHTYIIRAIEIIESTGISKSESFDTTPKLRFPTLFLTPYTDTIENRKKLYENINTRIEKMFTNGLVEEVEYIAKKYGHTCEGLKTIGYVEIMDFLSGKINKTEAQALIAQHNRNYAKRQITWNRKKYDPFL